MIVCVCNGVSDREIKKMIDAGAKSVRDIQAQSLAGTCCGICVTELKECLNREENKRNGNGINQNEAREK